MILSRFIRQIKGQHWLAFFIDFVIVVVGVFIGLQANNWNVARHDKTLERQYLVRLRDDLLLSIKNVDNNIAKMDTQVRFEGEMVRDLVACHLAPAERGRFAAGIFLIGQFEPPPLARGTIDELRSTGRLGLLHDVELRQKLAEALQLARINEGVLQMIIARATPEIAYLDQRAVITPPQGGYDFDAIRQGKMPAGVIHFDFDALCKDPRSAAAISSVQRMTNVVVIHNQTEGRHYKALVQIIARDLRLRR